MNHAENTKALQGLLTDDEILDIMILWEKHKVTASKKLAALLFEKHKWSITTLYAHGILININKEI